jgi:hypothetical protein
MQVIDALWRKQDKEFQSGILVWEESREEPVFHQLNPGDEIRWTVEGPRKCVGNRNSSGLVRCPESSILSKRGTRCGPCLALDVYDACIRCDGHSCLASAERRKKCETTEYVIYIATFGDDTAKVGVSSKKRNLTRWVEQGADYAAVVKTIMGGQQARLFEDRLSRIKGLTKNVRAGRKMDSLKKQISHEEAQELITSFLEKLEEKIPNPVDVINLSPYYSLDTLDAKPKRWHTPSETIQGLQLLGEIVGMKGSLLITSLAGGYTVVNLRELAGYTLDTTTNVNIVTQSGLSDFF